MRKYTKTTKETLNYVVLTDWTMCDRVFRSFNYFFRIFWPWIRYSRPNLVTFCITFSAILFGNFFQMNQMYSVQNLKKCWMRILWSLYSIKYGQTSKYFQTVYPFGNTSTTFILVYSIFPFLILPSSIFTTSDSKCELSNKRICLFCTWTGLTIQPQCQIIGRSSIWNVLRNTLIYLLKMTSLPIHS